ncbi:jg5724 [Pararge aegeria aegeria]|uniref:Jg5724 protein n=1 Tax=Pararge aegeria aegeria TaxID=348720 RepID=A0A8S4SHJ6_9NEOP|nr:jg5724 [Pararge aegeria aegeria]
MLCENLMLQSNSILMKRNLISIFADKFGRDPWMKVITKCLVSNITYSSPTGVPGSGAGKGGGAGGSVRESGGGLGQFGAAQEEQFFFNKQREQLEKIKKKLKDAKSGDLTRKEEK